MTIPELLAFYKHVKTIKAEKYIAALRCLAEIREHCELADLRLSENESLAMYGFAGIIQRAIERFEAGQYDQG